MRYLRARRPDALLAAMWPRTGLAGVATRLSGRPIKLVASEHVDLRMTPSLTSVDRFILGRFGQLLYAPFGRVVCVSSGVCESLSEIAGLKPDKLRVIYNPVRSLKPDNIPEQDRRLLNRWLNAEAKLIAVGSLKEQKGFDLLIRAVVELRKERDVQLLIVGEGGLRQELMNLARDLGIENCVTLIGFRKNPAGYLQHADRFVLSSQWEGFGNVIVEALSLGIPVISTDCPSGPSEILDDGKYGVLCETGSVTSLVGAISESLDCEHDIEFIKSRAHDFDRSQQAKLYLEELLG
jgi:glycosyltransferase involved in cell wall biosynthesis